MEDVDFITNAMITHTHTEVFVFYFMIGKPVSQRQSGFRMGYSAGQPQSPLSVSHPGLSFDEKPDYAKDSWES